MKSFDEQSNRLGPVFHVPAEGLWNYEKSWSFAPKCGTFASQLLANSLRDRKVESS